ncbi:hypothetical protein J6590_076212 [Homalodisca vitripennis]|nr:hypothetical protein J6590_076212 [Homalodisca vitripennis]
MKLESRQEAAPSPTLILTRPKYPATLKECEVPSRTQCNNRNRNNKICSDNIAVEIN